MTFEERVAYLAERHQALAESVEMITHQNAETATNLAKLETTVTSLATQVGTLGKTVDQLTAEVRNFREASQLNFDRVSVAMLGLTDHVAAHARRLDLLEER